VKRLNERARLLFGAGAPISPTDGIGSLKQGIGPECDRFGHTSFTMSIDGTSLRRVR
jgi:hypothetical protein